MRERLIEFFAEPALFPPEMGPEEWADELLDKIIDPEPVGYADLHDPTPLLGHPVHRWWYLWSVKPKEPPESVPLYRLREIEP